VFSLNVLPLLTAATLALLPITLVLSTLILLVFLGGNALLLIFLIFLLWTFLLIEMASTSLSLFENFTFLPQPSRVGNLIVFPGVIVNEAVLITELAIGNSTTMKYFFEVSLISGMYN